MVEPVIRPATLDDAALAADLMTAAYPPEPEDPVVTRYRWEHPRDGWSVGRFIAELESRPVAYLWWMHGPWKKLPERHCDIGADVDQARQSDELLDYLWGWTAEEATADGARIIHANAAVDEPNVIKALDRLGYERDRTEKVWKLDLERHGARLLEEARTARDKMKKEGIELVSLADWPGEDTYRSIHELNEMAEQDVPTNQPLLPQSLASFMDRISAPNLPHDRLWIARHGDRAVGMSFLRFPPVRGNVWTGFTCSHPDYRGRGIARAVKLQTLAQAIELGIPSVRTDNDSENAPMLHINEALGYDTLPGYINLVKRVSTT
jgi:GNAT superfamily N-acetyltransferase